MASKNATNLINKYITVNDTSTSFATNLDEFITTNRNKIIDRITDQIFEQLTQTKEYITALDLEDHNGPFNKETNPTNKDWIIKPTQTEINYYNTQYHKEKEIAKTKAKQAAVDKFNRLFNTPTDISTSAVNIYIIYDYFIHTCYKMI